jgi:hypothetical protein
MGAQLAATVYVRDPDTHQTVELAPGTLPEPRLAALVTSRAAWVDGKLPRLPKSQSSPDDPQVPADGPDGGSGAASDPDGPDQPPQDDQAAPTAKKTAAKKTAATSRSRGRNAADTGGE